MKKQNFQFVGKALWFPVEKILAIADLHIGYEEALTNLGVFLPRGQFAQTIGELKKIFEITGKVNLSIVLGDLKHEFGSILNQEWRETLEILDFLQENSRRVVLIKGNHDKMLGPIAKRKKIKLVESFFVDGICFCHGDKIIDECFSRKVKMVILGHRHPAVVISDKYKKEKYKCFLHGKFRGKEIVVLPSFFPLVEGSEVGRIEECGFIIPESKLKDFEVYAVGDEVYRMGRGRRFWELE